MTKNNCFFLSVCSISLLLSACDGADTKQSYPVDTEHRLKESRGKLSGDGISLFGKDGDNNSGSSSGIGVNSFLWRASLDTVSFMPLASADPFGGVIITDWYEDPNNKGERFKVNVLILDKTLRADGVKAKVFKQKKDDKGAWHDVAVSDNLARDMENTILTRARELKVSQLQK
jgi:hypothetical protein